MRPLWVDRILIEPHLKADLYAYFDAREQRESQALALAVRRNDMHAAALALGRLDGITLLRDDVKKFEKEDANVAFKKEKGG